MMLKSAVVRQLFSVLLLSMILLCCVSRIAMAERVLLSDTTSSYTRNDSVYISAASFITHNKLSNTKNDTITGRAFIVYQLYHDFNHLLRKPDFYLTVGGLGFIPEVLPSAFKHESPELTELWGSSTFADVFFESGEIIGDGAFPMLASASLWGISKIAGSSRLRDFSSDLFRAQIINGFFTMGLKVSIKRTRPDGTAYSYPSGHTSSVFTTAGVVYRHFGKRWGIPAFIVASYVGLSRLQENKHYLSDVIAGGILGGYLGLQVANHGAVGKQVTIQPVINRESRGLALSVTF